MSTTFYEENTVTMLAGPCSIESAEQMEEVSAALEDLGLHWIRGGAFKPRTSPYSFQGLGVEGMQIMADAGRRHHLATLTEVVDTACVETTTALVDGLQIGTRNMANFELLKVVGSATAENQKPVLFKRGMAALIDEWLSAAEYLTMGGNPNVMLCERGLRTFETATRFTLDIAAVPVIHKRSLLPICVDVSHPAGQADLIPALAKAAIAAGCDALMIEVHPDPPHAKSDGPQQLTIPVFAELLTELRSLAAALGKTIR
ncbi:MAG: 3-deoxy-7-phosphoheptulonate synthase [Coriobacteriales bacterium]|jgi:3-deoxy-7-phosphoheptulonate synthase|nr:3-deoxy-7-phosphoheptulonate synthase [Coriobacteriales bacterium]